MRILRPGFVASLAVVVAGCPGDRPPPPEIGAAVEPEPVITEATRQVPLQDMTGAGVGGEVIVTPFPDSVLFHLVVNDAAPESTFGARVHVGTCENPGDVVDVLEAVRTGVLGNGRSQRGLQEDPHRFLDGMHVVAVYASAADPGRDLPMLCGQIPAMR
jgi:hypothetical protein